MKPEKPVVYGRIIYRKSKVRIGMLESCLTFISSSRGTEYRVYIDLENKKYYIKNMTRESLIHMPEDIGVDHKNTLYMQAKNHLKVLGVVFRRELRNRQFGICEKGYTQKKHIEKLNCTKTE